MENMLDYYHTRWVVKCKLLALNLTGFSMTLFDTLLEESIDSWKDLSEAFTTRNQKLTTMALLSGITHRNKETLCEYINRFNKVKLALGDTYDKLKCWIFEMRLIPNCMFQEKLGLREAHS